VSVGALILVLGRVKSSFIHEQIDWTLLLFFAALFVVIRGFEASGATDLLIQRFSPWFHRGQWSQLVALSGLMLALSNLVSNVPAVLVLKPFVAGLPDPQRAWLLVAMASTLAGNLTLVGSVANLIVAQRARRYGVTIGFWPHFRVGAPLTFLTILVGLWWL